MTANSNSFTALRDTRRSARIDAQSPVLPLLVWLTLQLLTLALIVTRVPFAATKKFPQPAELIALQVMLVVQITGAAMLFPFLLRDLRATMMVIVGSWPFTVLAAFLTGIANPEKCAAVTAFVTVWIAGLALWQATLQTPRARGAGIAVAMLAALGGPILWYLRAEYAPSIVQSDAVAWATVAHWGPVMGALSLAVNKPWLMRGAWAFAGGHLIAAAVLRVLQRIMQRVRGSMSP